MVTLDQVIISVTSGAILIVIGLVVYIWQDAKGVIKNAVSEENCKQRREGEKKDFDRLEFDFRNHAHCECGKVKVIL